MARKLMVDLESEAFQKLIPQPPTRRNWRAMILESDDVARTKIRDRVDELEVGKVTLYVVSCLHKDVLSFAAESFSSLVMCGIPSRLVYQGSSTSIKQSDFEIPFEVDYTKKKLIDCVTAEEDLCGRRIIDHINQFRGDNRDTTLLFCLLGAMSYFDSSRPPAVTPFGYLSPQMLYVVCKLIGLKVRSLD